MTLKISKEECRRFLVDYQGLGTQNRYQGKSGIKAYLEKVGCIQYDPLNVVGRNADLTLQSRIDGYQANMLSELLYEDRLLVDGWDKQMSIYNVEDYSLLERVREAMGESTINTLKYRNSHEALEFIDEVKRSLMEIGAAKPGAIDIGAVSRSTWGHGKISSVVMDYLFHTGELGIKTKIGTQKVYDFIENLLPAEHINKSSGFASENDFYDWYVKRRIGSIGMYWDKNGDGWLGKHISKKAIRQPAIKRLLDRGDLVPVHVDGMTEVFYIRSEDQKLLQTVQSNSQRYTEDGSSKKVRFIAPLDNLIWDRKLIQSLFGFDYTWEVYKPESKRQYGYYVLPVLYGDRFIGRFEPEHVKGGKTLTVKNWWWEEGCSRSTSDIEAVMEAFDDFKAYLGISKIKKGLMKKLV